MAIVREQKQRSKNKRARSPPKSEEKNTTRDIVLRDDLIKADSNKRKKFKRSPEESLYETSEAQVSVLERAMEVAENLDPQFPSMVKVMLPSHVSGGFWLGLPRRFCLDHLPKQDTMFVLEDEMGEKFDTTYLVEKIGLSGGWRGFSTASQFAVWRCLSFHLVGKSKFKVYVVRSNGSGEVECALGLVQLDAGIGPVNSDNGVRERAENDNIEATSLENLDADIQRAKTSACNSKRGSMSDLSEDDTEDTICEVWE